MDNGTECYLRYLQGDKTAFNGIVEQYRSGLTFFINSFVCDNAIAEDIAIDVFMQLVIHKHRYNFKYSLKTYLYTIARTRSLDYIKHRRRLKETSVEDAPQLTETGKGLEDAFLDSELKKALYGAIATLGENMKTAVHLIYIEGLSYEDAGRIMKKSTKQIDNLLYRAKAILRENLKEWGDKL